jgi:hypothetical protein
MIANSLSYEIEDFKKCIINFNLEAGLSYSMSGGDCMFLTDGTDGRTDMLICL